MALTGYDARGHRAEDHGVVGWGARVRKAGGEKSVEGNAREELIPSHWQIRRGQRNATPLLFDPLRGYPKEELATKPATEIIAIAGESLFLIGLPVAHVEGIGYDSRTGFEFLKKLWPQTQVDLGQEKKRDHAGFVNVSLEKVVLLESDQVLDTRLFSAFFGLLDALRVYVDPYSARSIRLRGGNNDPAIPAT